MKITRNRALEVSRYCKEHNIVYSSMMSYPQAYNTAVTHDKRTTSGLQYHLPNEHTVPVDLGSRRSINDRAYILWRGEPLETIIEALAFIRMTTDRTNLVVLRCTNASIRAQELEADGPLPELTGDTHHAP